MFFIFALECKKFKSNNQIRDPKKKKKKRQNIEAALERCGRVVWSIMLLPNYYGLEHKHRFSRLFTFYLLIDSIDFHICMSLNRSYSFFFWGDKNLETPLVSKPHIIITISLWGFFLFIIYYLLFFSELGPHLLNKRSKNDYPI